MSEADFLILRKVPLFAGLDSGQIDALASMARVSLYPQDAAIIEEGEEGEGLFVILSGRVKVVKGLAGGGERVLATLGSTEFFGEMALLDGYPRSASVIALEDTRCLILSRWDLFILLRRDPEIAIHMLGILSQRLRNVQAMISE